MSVSVLIVNYRVYDDLDRALRSLELCLRPADEVLVFDQESDEVEAVRLAQAHPRVRIIAHKGNVGFAAGINRAARDASSPYLLWLNPDTLVEGPLIGTLEDWLSQHPGVAVAGPRVLNPDGSLQASARRFPGLSTGLAGRSTWLTRRFPQNRLTRRNLPGRDAQAPVEVDWLAGSCLMTRRTIFEALGGLDESFFMYWEDADFCRRAKDAGLGSTVYLPHACVRHVGGASAAHAKRAAVRAFHRSAHHFYRKHATPWQRVVSPAVGLVLRLRAGLLALRHPGQDD